MTVASALRQTTLLALAISTSGCALTRRTAADSVDQAKQMWRRGVAALDAGKAGEAESWLRKAAEATPEDGATQHHLAEALWQTGKHEEALRCAEEACRCAPTNLDAAIRAGQMRLARGDAGQAAAWGEQAIEIDAGSAAAWALRGRAQQRLGKADLALADYQQALRYAPTDPELLSDVAQLYRDRGDHRRCLTTLHQLLDAYPPGQEPAEALAQAGETYLALGRSRDATDTLRLAAQRGPGNADLFCRLAEAQAACGQNELAVADARRALSLDATHLGSRQLIARLQPADAAIR
ncbi:cellulose synthase subunit BcsC [Botrimarina colliarenosi]|uniref:Cellulose synthase subunit BcsC n=1 Tax=Botrimarina colliarenosi TaxID=2528001 RepID=A0A5C6AK16_9BACT|nr:tetratricopeptide repeat protein [Botrimarina colliarenosi]TWT99756.1 cellulose synthase subunit BcsC [Botrimarina colliarenosi]